MKIRKILPLLAIAVVALFALSSCDQMLESLFPADTGQLESQGTNSLLVKVAVNWNSNLQGTKIVIDLYDSTNTVIDYRAYFVSDTGYAVNHYSADFQFLTDGAYYVNVYIDTNGDYNPDFYGSPYNQYQYLDQNSNPNGTLDVTVY
jgi:uncharacterized protein (DUF2141 family)